MCGRPELRANPRGTLGSLSYNGFLPLKAVFVTHRNGPFDVLVDAANVAFFGQNHAGGGFCWKQVGDGARQQCVCGQTKWETVTLSTDSCGATSSDSTAVPIVNGMGDNARRWC